MAKGYSANAESPQYVIRGAAPIPKRIVDYVIREGLVKGEDDGLLGDHQSYSAARDDPKLANLLRRLAARVATTSKASSPQPRNRGVAGDRDRNVEGHDRPGEDTQGQPPAFFKPYCVFDRDGDSRREENLSVLHIGAEPVSEIGNDEDRR
jgi:hypothetical protein